MQGILRKGLTELQGDVFDVPYSEISGYQDMVLAEIDDAVEEAALLGYLDDQELMGSWIADLAKKIGSTVKKIVPKVKAAVAKIKAKKAEANAMMAPAADTSNISAVAKADKAPQSIMDQLKNPMVLGGIGVAALLVVLVVMKKKKKGGRR